MRSGWTYPFGWGLPHADTCPRRSERINLGSIMIRDPVQHFSQAADLTVLRDLVSAEIKRMGFHGFDLFSVHNGDIDVYEQAGNFFVCDYGWNLVSPYFSESWILTDPCLKEIGKRVAPFDYVAFLAQQPSSGAVRWQRAALAATNVRHAWSIPLNTPSALQGATVYLRGNGPERAELFAKSPAALHLLTACALERALEIQASKVTKTRASFNRLSARENDCLQWVEAGKTNWEIGQILSISENTVRYHLKNAFRKLDVTTRSAAIGALRRETSNQTA